MSLASFIAEGYEWSLTLSEAKMESLADQMSLLEGCKEGNPYSKT